MYSEFDFWWSANGVFEVGFGRKLRDYPTNFTRAKQPHWEFFRQGRSPPARREGIRLLIISEPHRNAKNRRNRSLHDNDEPHIISRWVQKQQSTTSIYWRIVSSNRLVTCVWSEMKQKREKICVVHDSRWCWLFVVFSFVRRNLNTKWWTLVKIFHYSLAERANKVSANFCCKNPKLIIPKRV